VTLKDIEAITNKYLLGDIFTTNKISTITTSTVTVTNSVTSSVTTSPFSLKLVYN